MCTLQKRQLGLIMSQLSFFLATSLDIVKVEQLECLWHPWPGLSYPSWRQFLLVH